jgi:predicted nucleic acid-binding protein
MRAVDTNVLVRLAARDDPKQVAAAEAFVARGAWVSHLVLAEAVWVLTSVYDLGPRDIATAVEHYRRIPRLGFSDCLVLEVARRSGHLPLGTFDRELGKLEGAQTL